MPVWVVSDPAVVSCRSWASGLTPVGASAEPRRDRHFLSTMGRARPFILVIRTTPSHAVGTSILPRIWGWIASRHAGRPVPRPAEWSQGMGNLASPATGEDGAEAEEQCCA